MPRLFVNLVDFHLRPAFHDPDAIWKTTGNAMNGILGNGTDAKSMCNTTSPPMKNLDLKKLLFDFFLFFFFFTWKWLLDYKFWIVQLLKSSKKCKVLGNFLKQFESRENSRNSKNFESFDWKSWKKCKVLGNLSIEERRENSRNFELPN